MPVQNSNSKISALPNFATNLLQMLISTTFHCLLGQKGQFSLHLCPRRWFDRKMFSYHPQKSKLKTFYRTFCLSKKEVFRKLTVQKTGRTVSGSDTVKRFQYQYWYQYWHQYRFLPIHSLKVLLTILTTVKLSFIRDCPGSITIHNKIHRAEMQLSTINRVVKILYHFISTWN